MSLASDRVLQHLAVCCFCRFCPLRRTATLQMKNHIKALDSWYIYLSPTTAASFQLTC